ncbi:MAG: GNAT family N-acetyltransferase [Anaerolineae bacterium]|nr:GNAT family N-acetyltransferase [Anaerolineae bacterium]
MPDFAIYQQSDLPTVLKWQAIAFMKVEWPFIFGGDLLFMTEPYPPDLHPVCFVASKGDSLISFASTLQLDLDHAGASYKVCGFGNLFTFPPYRCQGYGKRVLELATDFIKRSQVDVAILFCDPALEPFYAACGWEAALAPTRVGSPDEYELLQASRMMLFVSEKGKKGEMDFETHPLYIEWHW